MGIDTRLDPFLKNHTADPDAVVRSAPAEAIEKEWSDAAREAAAESRRRNVSGKTPKAPSGDLGGHHQALSRHGWEYTGDYGDKSKLYSHGGAPGEEIEVHPGGNWRHTAPGPAVPKTDEQGRRTLYSGGRVNVTGGDAKSLHEHLRTGAKVSPLPGRKITTGPGGKITTGPGGKIQSFEPNRYAHERFAPRKSETYSPVGKQAPPGPKVIEIGGDLDEDDVIERSMGPRIV